MSAPKITVRELVEASEWTEAPISEGWYWRINFDNGECSRDPYRLFYRHGAMLVDLGGASIEVSRLAGELWARAYPPAVPEHLRKRIVGL